MQLFFDRAERIRCLGFDDRWMLLLGIPLLAFVADALFRAALPRAVTFGSLESFVFLGVALLYTLFYWLLNRALAVYLRRRLPGEYPTTRRITLALVLALLLTLALEAITFLLRSYFAEALHRWDNPGFAYSVFVPFLLSVLIITMYEGIYFFTKYRQSLLEREQLARANVQAELAALRQQVNPHFLFNSLNTLANLIPEDPTKATRFVQRLSAVYRRILEYRHEVSVPLAVELTALADYLFLLETRFEEKLTVHIDVPARYRKAHIVPLAIQLLVENAVKHNVVSAAHPLVIDISVADDYLVVRNNYHPRSSRVASTGLGQANIVQRYRLLTTRPVRVHPPVDHYQVDLPLIVSPSTLTPRIPPRS